MHCYVFWNDIDYVIEAFERGILMIYTRLLAAVCVLFLFSGCVAPTRSEGLTIEDQTVNDLTISLALASSPRVNEPQRANVMLINTQGQFIDGTTVGLVTVAPDGTEQTIPLLRTGEGSYQDNAVVFNVVGLWELIIIVELEGQEYRASFTRDVVD